MKTTMAGDTTPDTAKGFADALIPGLFAGVLLIIMSVSLSALIFSGPLAVFLVDGIGMAVITAVVVGLVFALFGRFHPIVAQLDEDTAPIFALMATLVVQAIAGTASADVVFASVIASIVIATIVSGIGLALLGAFRFGAFIQYLPHSVIGGYFAALGWLLIVGALVVAEPSREAGTAATAISGWVPAILVAAWLVIMKKRLSRTILLPGTVLVATTLYFGIGLIVGEGPGELLQSGFLIGPFVDARTLGIGPLGNADFADVDWMAIVRNLGSTGTIFLISIMSLLFCVSGLSLAYRRDPDMNHQLKTAGLANVASGLCGGMLGLPTYNLSLQAHEMGAPNNRWTSLVAIAFCLAVFLFGLGLVAYTPRFVISGLLMFLGASLLREWLIDGWRKFSFLEYLVVPIILLSAVTLGFLKSILVGLVAAIVVFVVKYSRIRVVRYSASSGEVMSNVDRNVEAERTVRENGAKVYILGLQGFLFFGTAGKVLDKLRSRIANDAEPPLECAVLEFHQVSGVDASAAINFQKMERLAANHDFYLVIAGLDNKLQERLRQGGFGAERPDRLRYVSDLDHALEFAENHILSEIEGSQQARSCFEQIRPYLRDDDDVAMLETYLERREVAAGTVLTEQGSDSTELFFVETCAASAYIEQPDGEPLRVRTTEEGTVYGELGFYLGIPRTASVQTDEAGIIYVLSRDSLRRMEDEHPNVAAGMHRFMAMLLSERLLYTTQSLKAVMF